MSARPWLLPLLLFGVLVALYQANGVAIPGGDTVPHRYLPFSLLCDHSLAMEDLPIRTDRAGRIFVPYWLAPARDGHLVSTFGFLPGLLATPLYALAWAFSDTFSYERVLTLSKWVASLLVAGSGVLLYGALRVRCARGDALLLALVYGLATSAWSVMSQSLWQHSAAAPFLAGALLCLLKGQERPAWTPWAGLLLGLATLARPTNGILALAFTLYVGLNQPGQLRSFLALALPPALAQGAWGWWAFGHPLATGQLVVASSVAMAKTGAHRIWASDGLALAEGLAGTLFSPSRGLLVYSPVLLLGFAGLAAALGDRKEALLRWTGLGVVGVLFLHGLRFDWWGGWTFGYRLVLDVLPFLVLAMVPTLPALKARWAPRLMALGLLVLSLGVQVLGAFTYDLVTWNSTPDVDQHPERLWSWSDSQLMAHLAHPALRTRFDGYDVPAGTLRICPVERVEP